MLWFAFWQGLAAGKTPGGTLAAGLGAAIAAILVAGLLCHFLFYLVPGLLGVETGLPLYVVGAQPMGLAVRSSCPDCSWACYSSAGSA